MARFVNIATVEDFEQHSGGVYFAHLLDNTGAPLRCGKSTWIIDNDRGDILYPHLASSVVDIGVGDNVLERWFTPQKAELMALLRTLALPSGWSLCVSGVVITPEQARRWKGYVADCKSARSPDKARFGANHLSTEDINVVLENICTRMFALMTGGPPFLAGKHNLLTDQPNKWIIKDSTLKAVANGIGWSVVDQLVRCLVLPTSGNSVGHGEDRDHANAALCRYRGIRGALENFDLVSSTAMHEDAIHIGLKPGHRDRFFSVHDIGGHAATATGSEAAPLLEAIEFVAQRSQIPVGELLWKTSSEPVRRTKHSGYGQVSYADTNDLPIN
jgi:hypothetical protein